MQSQVHLFVPQLGQDYGPKMRLTRTPRSRYIACILVTSWYTGCLDSAHPSWCGLPIKCAVDEIPAKPDAHVLALAYQDANKGRMDTILRTSKDEVRKEDMAYGSDGHGGSCECSIALVEKPDCVRMDRRLVPDRTLVDIRRNLGFTVTLPIETYATKGIFGDPSNISREFGEYLAAETAKEIARRVREFGIVSKPVRKSVDRLTLFGAKFPQSNVMTGGWSHLMASSRMSKVSTSDRAP
jgi:hypothetical protein